MSTVVTTGLRHTSYVGNNIILDSGGGVYAAGVVNATSYTTGSTGTGTGGLIANTTVLFLGNNTINATMNTTSLKIGGTFGIGGGNALQGEFNATGLTIYAAGVTPQHDGPLHVMSGSAGTVTATSNYHDVVIEGSAPNVGVNILAPDASRSAFVMGSPTATEGAEINWKYSTGDMQIGTNKASTGLIGFYVANFSQRGEWNTTGLTCFASGVTPQHDGVLHVMSGSAGTISARSDADDLIIEAATEAGMSILTGDNALARIRMTNPTDGNSGGALLAWDDSVSQFSMQTATAGSVLRFSTGAQQLSGEWNTTGLTCFASGVTPQHDSVLHVMKASAGTVTAGSQHPLVVEMNSGGTGAGINLLNADAGYSQIAMGSPTNSEGFEILYRYSDSAAYIRTKFAGASLVFASGNSTTALTLNSDQTSTFAKTITVNPSVGDSARATAIALTVSSRANFTTHVGQWNPAISTVAAILDVISSDAVGIVTVRGEQAGNKFADCVFFHANGATALNSGTVNGTPSARTYSVNAGVLRLAMASGTYTVAVGGTLTYQ